ncbi:cilia- and flagella-associated protein 46 isoform X3 [Ornithorhynchus anatinus]|uniref:cilia- and flagella-associated protein 46 isoform X3 n=1 Tax=Ornithorhynchus anatinus TaxID=9258 RepID=UPI0010A7A425|nr:cilia- and flagella-associated protein 46 isoform X3 [Ornithorhynchus anatinus]
MDLMIRQLLCGAENHQDTESLKKAYEFIKAANEGKSALDSSESFSSDLYVLCAEQALQLGYPEISATCLQMYFKGNPPSNQFLGRAHLCEAQLHTPHSADNLEEFEKSVIHYMKAINFAKEDSRYYFLIYNASVLYWQMVRPFLKPGSRHFLIPSLSQIVAVLNEATKKDKEWTAELMLELLECFLDARKTAEAAEFSSTAAAYIKVNVPHKYPQLFSIMVHHKLMDDSQMETEMQESVNLSVIYNIQALKSKLGGKEMPQEADTYLQNAYKLLKQYDHQSVTSIGDERMPLLLELARLSLTMKSIELSYDCICDLKEFKNDDPGRQIEIECLEYEFQVLKLGNKMKTYARSAVETLLNVIKSLDVVLPRAIRMGDPNLIQVVCATQWNLCLPLLQHNLRCNLRKSLTNIAEILEKIDSLMVEMRCQVHVEIAHIEEDEDRIEAAMDHLQKAMHLDDKGQYRDHLQMAFNRLGLCSLLYQSPERREDKAIKTIEQAKKARQKDSVRKKRALLVNAGLALAPDTFQIVLDSENEAKVSTGKSRSQISFLCAKAHHHTKSVEKAGGHLKRLGRENEKERIQIWADLAKVARKQGVWDVCRTASRFCLLYDDMIFKKTSRPTKEIAVSAVLSEKKKKTLESPDRMLSDPSESSQPAKSLSPDLLRTFAEVGFINAEATIHLLHSEGTQLNDQAVPPEDLSQHPIGYVSLPPSQDPEWLEYCSWIKNLSQYAMKSLLRSAEIGQEINEAWIVHNAVVYVLNHNRHLIAAGRQRELVAPLQKLLNIMKVTGHCGNTVILVTLCNALARGLMLSWIPPFPKNEEMKTVESTTEKYKKAAIKIIEKPNQAQITSVDPSGVLEIKSALEICEFALHLTNGSLPEEVIPIHVRQQLIVTWVKAKQLSQQQIGPKLGTDSENGNGGQDPMTKVLVALEMYSCNGLGLMEFTVPSLTQLVTLALECSWSDVLVELQTLTRLTHFAYALRDHDKVMLCSQAVTQLHERSFKDVTSKTSKVGEREFRAEMLSTAYCVRGKSIMENLAGKNELRFAAVASFVQSARFAGIARSSELVMLATRHFWNACLPLLGSKVHREKLKVPTRTIIKIINESESRNQEETESSLLLHQWPTMDFQTTGTTEGCFCPGAEDDLTLRASLYGLLFHMHADKNDWETGLKVLDEAIQALPRTSHRLLIFKHMVIVKAKLGLSFLRDIQKFKDESEDYLSHMWHRLALNSKDLHRQLTCFQNAIEALQKQENAWQKVDFLMEFAEWLYFKQFPLTDAIYQLNWAIDISLQMTYSLNLVEEEEKSYLTPAAYLETQTSKEIKQITINDIRNVRQLETLFRAHTIMAFILPHSSSNHQEHCLMAYAYVMRIWKISLATAGNHIQAANRTPVTGQQSTPSKKEKQKSKGKDKESKENPKPKKESKPVQPVLVKPADTMPGSVEEWALYDCPEEIITVFKQHPDGCSINRESFLKPTYSLYYLDLLVKVMQTISLTHLTLPILHLAKVIVDVAVDCRSLSDLYHLRIAQTCYDLKLSRAASFHEEKVGGIYINEMEQANCRKEIALRKEKNVQPTKKEEAGNTLDQKTIPGLTQDKPLEAKEKILNINAETGKGLCSLSFPYLWISKAEALLELGLYQPTRLLLAEAYAALQELNDPCAVSKCLHLLAELAIKENKYGQAKALIEAAQHIGGNEEFWYKSTLSFVETIVAGEREGKERMACNILQKTINVFQIVLKERPNRDCLLGFWITSLEARKIDFQIMLYQNSESGNTSQLPSVPEEICEALMQLGEDFLHFGYIEHSTEIKMKHAKLISLLAKNEKNEEAKHSYYLESHVLAQRAVAEEEERFQNIQSLSPCDETQNISTPLMRKLANLKLSLVEITLDILQVIQTETFIKQLEKESLKRILSEYMRNTSDVTSEEYKWFMLSRTLAPEILAHLAILPILSTGCTEIRANFLHFMGKTLHLLAIQVDPVNPSSYWDDNFLLAAKLNASNEFAEDTESNKSAIPSLESHLNEPMGEKQRRKGIELKQRMVLAQRYLSQATEVFLQSMSITFSNNILHTLAASSLEMVECLGRLDPNAAVQFLAVYQSCSASLMMKEILLTATRDTSSSQPAALLQLLQQLELQGKTTSQLFTKAEAKLATISKAWQNLCVPIQHFNILNEIPSNFHIVILQHSEDRSFLYSAILEKPKFIVGAKGKPLQIGGHSKISRIAVDSASLSRLIADVQDFKQKVKTSLFKETQFSLGGEAQAKTPILAAEEENMQRFSNIWKSMENYLRPVLSVFNSSDLRIPTPSLSIEEGKPKSREKDSPGAPAEAADYAIIMADRLLQELPLEALSVFEEGMVLSVSREFSLQMLHNRLRKEEPAEVVIKKEGKGTKDPKTKGGQKKNTKSAPLSRVLPPNCIGIDTNNFKYIVDPFEEATAVEHLSPSFKMREILERYRDQFTSRWVGFIGKKSFPSQAEWEQFLTDCSAFLFYGMEQFSTHILVDRLAAMNLRDCQLVILLDMVQSTQSLQRRSKFDENKSTRQLLIERPIETAVLLSLCGVHSVIINQWHTTLQHNARRLQVLCENLLRTGRTNGKTVHLFHRQGMEEMVIEEESLKTVKERKTSHPSTSRILVSELKLPLSAYNLVIYGLPNLMVI